MTATEAVSVSAVDLRNVGKVFDVSRQSVPVLVDLSLRVEPGEFICIVGASGCGKSTLLNLISGLDTPTSGSIALGDSRVALMFQDSALFPWLTVRENVAMPMKFRGTGKAERSARVDELLELVRLQHFGDERPHRLSGGMRQRVALARALAQDADVLLMDEPFAALDAMTRDLLHQELERIWQLRRMSVVFVTHNVREAARLADRIVVLASRPGRLLREFSVDIARPRRIESPEVGGLALRVASALEVAHHDAG